MDALCFERFGGPEVLSLREVPDSVAGPGHVLVRTHAIGLNYADVYRRQGHYHLEGQPPFIAGYEAAGEVVGTGERVGLADVPHCNATLVSASIDKLIPLPSDISYDVAAAALLQGLTAQYLVRDSHELRVGETVVVHAAAGGVGSLLTQLATHLGARVIAIVSSEEKAQVARSLGAVTTALYADDWVAAARGADVVYDSIGTTVLQSLSAVRTGGHVVYFGKAGGEPPAIPPSLLMDGSKRVTGGDLWNVLTSADERKRRASELFQWIRSGVLRVDISASFALADGAEAHRLLESRRSTGKILLRPT